MVTSEQLQKLFPEDGKKHFDYLNNKHRGGVNNSKGNTFENQFAVYKIAGSFNDDEDQERTLFSAQALCFIDDLIIEKEHTNIVEHYQLKDSEGVQWHQQPHSLKEDFIMQYSICKDNGKEPLLNLVVSQSQVSDRLTAEMDDELKKIASVVHFQNARTINSLISQNKLFREELINMCGLSNPATDKLDVLGTIIMGVWGGIEQNKVSLRDIVDKCRTVNPNYIRGAANDISEKLKTLLNSIPGFAFRIEGGYVRWIYKETDNGTISFMIGTKKFENWENEVLATGKISTFEDLEIHLI